MTDTLGSTPLRRYAIALGVAALSVAVLAPSALGATAKTKRMSVSSAGVETDADSHTPVISADRRYVAFVTEADTLVSGDNNAVADVFVRDRSKKRTKRVSVKSNGTEFAGESSHPAISANGRFVAFNSAVPEVAGGSIAGDVYVRDRASGKTRRVSRRPNGKRPNGPSESPDISGNGRYVAYTSKASNIVPNDTNGTWDIFVYDRSSGQTSRVSVKSNGKQAKGPSTDPAISASGRFVAFVSGARNLVKADTSFIKDIYVHDRLTGKTRRVSVKSNGKEADSFSLSPRLSGDGRIVTFESFATNLVKNDSNGKYDIFTHDRATGKTRRVSVHANGGQATGDSGGPDISANGRFVTFWSRAENLVSGDSNLVNDVFVHDRKSKKTKRVSVATGGAQANDNSHTPAIDAKGKAVVFVSDAKNLIPADANEVFDVFYRGPLR